MVTVRTRSRRQAAQDGWQRYVSAEHDLIRFARQRNTLASLAVVGWLGFLRMLALYYLGW
jgi:hypothetical protein